MRLPRTVVFVLVIGAVGITTEVEGQYQKLTAVPFTDVRIDDEFWAPRLDTVRDKTLPHNLKFCERTGRLSNFAKAGGLIEGEFRGIYFNDSDVYKVLEGAAYSLASHPDKELDRQVDEIIAWIGSAQEENGYLNSYYTLAEPDKKWTNLRNKHELYCAGHLFEAAVAHYRATGKRTLLDVACRFADHIDAIFGPDKRHGVPGHEEIELALVKLWRVTGEERYLKLAEFFLDERGRARGRRLYGDYCQDHKPLEEQSEICGHAVRAMYLYSGVADVAAITGDKAYIDAMERIWRDVVFRKMYITGGIGPSASNEGFTVAYDLPNDSAYAETCASIGMVLWNHRLNLLHGEARFADIVERVLYNGMLSGLSFDGEKFFYVNPLASQGKHHRKPWYNCACCPTNVARFMPTVGGYVYAHSDDAIYLNLYVAGEGTVRLKDSSVELTQQTRYPWDGIVKISVEPAVSATFDICLRIPAWCEGARLKVNGEMLSKLEIQNGYAGINRKWTRGDLIELDLPMPIERIEAHPSVKANTGRVALQRGPIVYCLEAVDNGGRVRQLAVPRDAKLTSEHRPGLLGGVTVIKGSAVVASVKDWDDTLYRAASQSRPVDFVAVPYYAWDNREPGEMVVWIPETIALAESSPRLDAPSNSKEEG
jgi:DUF1680 family protein